LPVDHKGVVPTREGGQERAARYEIEEPDENSAVALAHAVAYPRAVVVENFYAKAAGFAVVSPQRTVYLARNTLLQSKLHRSQSENLHLLTSQHASAFHRLNV